MLKCEILIYANERGWLPRAYVHENYFLQRDSQELIFEATDSQDTKVMC